MTFEEWWDTLPAIERKLIGQNNGAFVWDNAVEKTNHALFMPKFMISTVEDKVIIMCIGGKNEGEGGMFPLSEFEDAVAKFFAEKF